MFFNNHIGDKGFDFEVLIVFEVFDVSQVKETHKVPNVVIVIEKKNVANDGELIDSNDFINCAKF